MQVLEGDEAVVLALYARIEADPRHAGVSTLIALPQPARLFPEWTMAFRNLGDPALHGTPGYATLAQFVARNPAPELDSRLVLTLLHALVQSSRQAERTLGHGVSHVPAGYATQGVSPGFSCITSRQQHHVREYVMDDPTADPTAPDWPSPQHEIAVLRAALHALVRDTLAGQPVPDHVLHDEQTIVDYYITQARGQQDHS